MSSPSSVSYSSSASAICSSSLRCSVRIVVARSYCVGHDAPDLGVDALRGVLAEVVAVREVTAEEHLLLAAREVQRAELVAHAPLGDHRPGELGRALDVVAGAGRLLAEHDLLGDPAAHQDRDLVERELARSC